MVLAWENLRRFLWCWSSFCCCCYSSFANFIHIFFLTSSLTLPWTIARFLDPFSTFSPVHRRAICDTFIFQPFHYFLTASATVLSGHFLPTGVFYLTLLPNSFGTFPTFLAHSRHFGTTCFHQAFTGSWQLLFWKLLGFILILETQIRPNCLFDSQ